MTSKGAWLCPECGSASIHCDIGVTQKIATHSENKISNTLVYLPSFFGAKLTPVNLFVCVECGYVKSFIGDTKTLSQIAEKWPKAEDMLPPPGQQ